MIYCPQCGSGMSETTKFCKNCGLPLAQLTTYVQTGGTAPLASPPPTSPTHKPKKTNFLETLTPRQRLVLLILMMVFAPAFLAALGDFGGPFRLFEALVPLAALLMVPGIIWAVFDYRNRMRQLSPPPWVQGQPLPPVNPQAHQMPPAQAQQPPYQPPQHTRPLPDVQGSVVEGETQRLPENRR
ncbi:MAG TPA: zinc ribbon domain-containing protein [Blastocatellia bacterium]|nr:zinc ribbon domain-containing protein [Blastocatellia bacterium]